MRYDVSHIKSGIRDDIKVDLIVKNIDGSDFSYKENIDNIDRYVPESYSEGTLGECLIV